MSTQPIVEMQTNKGNIIIELNAEKAPISTANFLSYVRDNFYEKTIFHRVIPNFMIQGGGFTPEMGQKKTNSEIKNEADNGLKNLRGSLAMARTQIVDSASSQFFINLADNDFLNHQGKTPNSYGYAVFGQVIQGMDVVDEIAKVDTGNSGHHQDVPKEAVIIEKVSVQEATDTE
ncbi:peptidylprolyl isomerase [uncultured Desulfuromusa sp.]|uniref:peptidylprolyl isomerase n=1 Tax=uncultured Desulfuromusa sp. TaxID=219183 RepID=UPI002AA86990|nr:peptidylprolyl isomerase [uncultured Desulfuromusa sp.]